MTACELVKQINDLESSREERHGTTHAYVE